MPWIKLSRQFTSNLVTTTTGDDDHWYNDGTILSNHAYAKDQEDHVPWYEGNSSDWDPSIPEEEDNDDDNNADEKEEDEMEEMEKEEDVEDSDEDAGATPPAKKQKQP